MDPLSITTGIVSLLSGLTALSKQITSFAVVAHGAKADMDAFLKEIASLTPCLEALNRPDLIRYYPDALRPNLVTIIRECDGVAVKMRELLSKLASASVGRRMQWSLASRDETDRLRQSLEAHKSALQIAISLVSLSATQSLQNDTSSIRAKAALIPEMRADTAQIAELRREIAALRMDMNLQHVRFSVPMQRFLDESTAYAETVCDDIPDANERAIPEASGTSRRASQASESPTHASATEANGSRPLQVHTPNHNPPPSQEDSTCEQQEFVNKLPNATNPFRKSRVTPPTPITNVILASDSDVEDRSDVFKDADEVNHQNSKSISEPPTEDAEKDTWLKVGLDRSIENAREVEDWPRPNHELQKWAKEFSGIVHVVNTEGDKRGMKILGHSAPFDFKTISARKKIAEAKAKLLTMVLPAPAGAAHLYSDAERLGTLLFHPNALDNCRMFFETAALAGKPIHLEPLFETKILQHAIRLGHYDIFGIKSLFERIVGRATNPTLIYNAEILRTAVRCGAIHVIQKLLKAGLQTRSITPNDAWLGSCYAVWLSYGMKTSTSLYYAGPFRSDFLRSDAEPGGLFDHSVTREQWNTPIAYKAFAAIKAHVREVEENRIRETLGWRPIDFLARARDERRRDVLACSQYLDVKSKDYANQPWSTYKRLQVLRDTSGYLWE